MEDGSWATGPPCRLAQAVTRCRATPLVSGSYASRMSSRRNCGTAPALRAELLHVLILPDFRGSTRSASRGGTQRHAPSPSS
jgi:hypothetical protein